MQKEPKISNLKDVPLATHTNKITYETQGIYESSDYTDINSIALSQNQKCLLIANDQGEVQLTNFPAICAKQKRKKFKGHSSHVTKVCWGAKDLFVASTGGYDKGVFIWDVLNMDKELVEDENQGEIREKRKGGA